MINCYNVTEEEWYDADDEVPIIEWYDIEDKREAEKKAAALRKRYPFVQLEEN